MRIRLPRSAGGSPAPLSIAKPVQASRLHYGKAGKPAKLCRSAKKGA
jgi:hypothetical protein